MHQVLPFLFLFSLPSLRRNAVMLYESSPGSELRTIGTVHHSHINCSWQTASYRMGPQEMLTEFNRTILPGTMNPRNIIIFCFNHNGSIEIGAYITNKWEQVTHFIKSFIYEGYSKSLWKWSIMKKLCKDFKMVWHLKTFFFNWRGIERKWLCHRVCF